MPPQHLYNELACPAYYSFCTEMDQWRRDIGGKWGGGGIAPGSTLLGAEFWEKHEKIDPLEYV